MSENAAPLVSAIVPTRQAARTLRKCLEALRAQSIPVEIIVVDNGSTDATPDIAKRLSDRVLTVGPERSAQRNAGATEAHGAVLAFIDADMVLERTVLEEAAGHIRAGAGSVVIPERSFGTGFWAAVRAYERSFYVGVDRVEAARCFDRALFERVGGFDQALLGGEDWDLAERARARSPVARTRAFAHHDEGTLTFLKACRKKAYYAGGLRQYARSRGGVAAVHILRRPYIRKPWKLLFPHPLLGAGVAALKSGEALFVARALVGNHSGAPESSPESATGASIATPRLTLGVAIPSYCEGSRIEATLESCWHAAQTLGADTPFYLSDSSPSSDTVCAARAWAARRGARLTVDYSANRRSVKEALNAIFELSDTDLLAIVDADVLVDEQALVRLVSALQTCPPAAVAVGVALPDPRYATWAHRRAGSWQLRAVTRLARLLPDDAIRAEGAIWAVRQDVYRSFRFAPGRGSIAADVQLADWARSTGVGVRNAKDAVAYKVPPEGSEDFALSFLRARAAAPREVSGRVAWAAMRELIADPRGAAAYLVYRLAVRAHRRRLVPMATSERWERTWSTVHPVEPEQ